jgi:two-component system, NarL family, invasion response regulator UvrY
MKHIARATVALVDDHTIFRQGLIEVLVHLGYEVTIEASNGKDLLQQLTSKPLPTVCILDIHMPEMDGFETTRLLKQYYPAIKVLALSTDNSDTSVSRMIASGADGFLEKGGSLDDISTSIASILARPTI